MVLGLLPAARATETRCQRHSSSHPGNSGDATDTSVRVSGLLHWPWRTFDLSAASLRDTQAVGWSQVDMQ